MPANDLSQQQYHKMTETPIPRLILSLAAPTILSMLITSIYNLADTFFVGQLSTSASGAVGIVSSLMAIIQALGFMFGHGAGGIISRSLGSRDTTAAHWQTMRDHGWSDAFTVDIMDEEGPDLQLLIPNGKVIQKYYVGKHLTRYDSLLVLSHFKGHPMGGFGGALKQLSIGVASSYGKAYIHGAGDAKVSFGADHDSFLASMADAASSVAKRFAGSAVYINVMKNLSVDCDCCAVAENPCMADIGIMASLDPIAIDQACVDMVYAATDDPGQKHMLERIESRHGIYTIECAAELGFGSREYERVDLD